MAAATLREQLNAHIDSMYTLGMVDEEFEQLQMLQDDRSSPGFFAEVVTLFHHVADRIIIELKDVVFKSASLGNELYRVYKVDLICSGIRIVRREQPTVDFDKVDAYMHQLKGSSTSACAQKVKFTCIQFRQDKNRDGSRYQTLKQKVDEIDTQLRELKADKLESERDARLKETVGSLK